MRVPDLQVLLPPHQGEPQQQVPGVSHALRRRDGRVQSDQARRDEAPASGQEAARQAPQGLGARHAEQGQRPRPPTHAGPDHGHDDAASQRGYARPAQGQRALRQVRQDQPPLHVEALPDLGQRARPVAPGVPARERLRVLPHADRGVALHRRDRRDPVARGQQAARHVGHDALLPQLPQGHPVPRLQLHLCARAGRGDRGPAPVDQGRDLHLRLGDRLEAQGGRTFVGRRQKGARGVAPGVGVVGEQERAAAADDAHHPQPAPPPALGHAPQTPSAAHVGPETADPPSPSSPVVPRKAGRRRRCCSCCRHSRCRRVVVVHRLGLGLGVDLGLALERCCSHCSRSRRRARVAVRLGAADADRRAQGGRRVRARPRAPRRARRVDLALAVAAPGLAARARRARAVRPVRGPLGPVRQRRVRRAGVRRAVVPLVPRPRVWRRERLQLQPRRQGQGARGAAGPAAAAAAAGRRADAVPRLWQPWRPPGRDALVGVGVGFVVHGLVRPVRRERLLGLVGRPALRVALAALDRRGPVAAQLALRLRAPLVVVGRPEPVARRPPRRHGQRPHVARRAVRPARHRPPAARRQLQRRRAARLGLERRHARHGACVPAGRPALARLAERLGLVVAAAVAARARDAPARLRPAAARSRRHQRRRQLGPPAAARAHAGSRRAHPRRVVPAAAARAARRRRVVEQQHGRQGGPARAHRGRAGERAQAAPAAPAPAASAADAGAEPGAAPVLLGPGHPQRAPRVGTGQRAAAAAAVDGSVRPAAAAAAVAVPARHEAAVRPPAAAAGAPATAAAAAAAAPGHVPADGRPARPGLVLARPGPLPPSSPCSLSRSNPFLHFLFASLHRPARSPFPPPPSTPSRMRSCTPWRRHARASLPWSSPPLPPLQLCLPLTPRAIKLVARALQRTRFPSLFLRARDALESSRATRRERAQAAASERMHPRREPLSRSSSLSAGP